MFSFSIFTLKRQPLGQAVQIRLLVSIIGLLFFDEVSMTFCGDSLKTISSFSALCNFSQGRIKRSISGGLSSSYFRSKTVLPSAFKLRLVFCISSAALK